MNHTNDLLDAVVEALNGRRGELPEVAKLAGLSYDTVLRIKSRENDPGYSKVKRLAEVLAIRAVVGERVHELSKVEGSEKLEAETAPQSAQPEASNAA